MGNNESFDDSLHERLREQYNELASLAGSLAHEIKNPLSVILMNMDLLAEELESADTPREQRLRRKISIVQDQCVRLENLLNDFLRFARLGHLELSPGNLNEIVAQVLTLYEPQAQEAHVEVITYLDHSLPTILVHAETLQAAILNLVKNALEALTKGGHLVVRTYVSTQGVALDLIDDGCGIDDRTAMKMFEAFFSTKSGGSGLGLPTARKIIEAHGGTIHVQSEVGRGTKFTVEFPVPKRLGKSSGERWATPPAGPIRS
jgi:signal transduction histidine kinase